MTTLTRQVGTFFDGTVVVSFDWDDVTGDILAIRGVNGRGRAVDVTLRGVGAGAAGRTRTAALATGTRADNIPVASRPRLPIVTNSRGVPLPDGYAILIGF